MSEAVQRVSGVVLSEPAARLVVAALDELFRLTQRRGGVPAGRVVEVRNSLYAAVVRRPRGDADELAEGDPGVATVDLAEWVGTTEAGSVLGVSGSGVRWLREHGHLEGEFRTGRWWISSLSLEEYARQRGTCAGASAKAIPAPSV